MRAARVEAPDQAHVVTVAEPVPGLGEVLIKVRAAGICGTDLHIYHGEYEAAYPIIPGHEFSGTVATVGEDVRRFKAGAITWRRLALRGMGGSRNMSWPPRAMSSQSARYRLRLLRWSNR